MRHLHANLNIRQLEAQAARPAPVREILFESDFSSFFIYTPKK